MTKIFLVRHGEAEGNYYRRCQGQFDAPLTPCGRAQAETLKERFAAMELSAVYASDLQRAADTVAIASGRSVITDERLREVCFGIWEGRPWGNLTREYPEEIGNFLFAPYRFAVPGSESLEAVRARMEEALLEIGARHEGENVMVGSHGMAIRVLMAKLMGLAPEQLGEIRTPDNTAVAVVLYENGQLRAESYNDTEHLPEALRGNGKRKWLGKNGFADTNLRFERMDVEKERRLFLDCYEDAWRHAHGSLQGFDETACWLGALCRARTSERAVQSVWQGEEFAGVLALDELRGEQHGYGWVSFLYLRPEMRGKGFGIQLIGEVVSRFRELGRKRVRLCTAPKNPALGFYEHMGFVRCGSEPGALEKLIRLEKEL